MDGPWPEVFLVGAPKAGTTALYRYLATHPGIHAPADKEPHHFSHGLDETPWAPPIPHGHTFMADHDEASYQALYAGRTGLGLDASTSYLAHPEAAERIHAVRPDAKILILLRDPLARAHSHYLMAMRGLGRHVLLHDYGEHGFLDAVRHELDPRWRDRVYHRFVEQSLYADGVARFLDHFGPDQVWVGLSRDLSRDRDATLASVLGFLGLPPAPAMEAAARRRHNAYKGPRNRLAAWVLDRAGLRRAARRVVPRPVRDLVGNRVLLAEGERPAVEPEAVALLAPLFRADLERLEDVMGRPLPGLWGEWSQ